MKTVRVPITTMLKQEEEIIIAKQAIKHAIKALRKRHLIEEAAHAPASLALSRPLLSQVWHLNETVELPFLYIGHWTEGSEWKAKAENLEVELQQCYKAQSRLLEQLVVEVAESRDSKTLVQQKEALINDLQNELAQSRDESSRLNTLIEEKTKALALIINEHRDVKIQLEAATVRADNLEAENKMLIDQWMLQKMLEAERLNEANAIYEDMMNDIKITSIQRLARQKVDGVVCQSEEEGEYYVDSTVPNICKQ